MITRSRPIEFTENNLKNQVNNGYYKAHESNDVCRDLYFLLFGFSDVCGRACRFRVVGIDFVFHKYLFLTHLGVK